ncbi:MAG: YkgJ family cysteine cluster protein [Deltaproteobacteria bacterium]|nr:YkgJ family cysteine cluster protein [Deltaproteobacteria bacterium]
MEKEHLFRFHCHPGLSCFTRCCGDITIVLTPYDVLRLKNNLGISSDEFLEKHTIVVSKEKRLLPIVILKMDEGDKRCPFVTEDGCVVYPDRPWPCRMYPLNIADDGTFHLITDSEHCKGLEETKEKKIEDWLAEQAIEPYEAMNELFAGITRPLMAQDLDIDNPDITKMTFMALYNLDRFRDFVFSSSFLNRFDVEPDRVEKIKKDDLELLKFAVDWVKFGLFGEKLFWVKDKGPE